MFQLIFRMQNQQIMAWPMLALFIFLAIFAAQCIAIFRKSKREIMQLAALPLADSLESSDAHFQDILPTSTALKTTAKETL